MGRILLMIAISLSLTSSTNAKGAVKSAAKCSLRHYPNLACEPQQVRCICDASAHCNWVFHCGDDRVPPQGRPFIRP